MKMLRDKSPLNAAFPVMNYC